MSTRDDYRGAIVFLRVAHFFIQRATQTLPRQSKSLPVLIELAIASASALAMVDEEEKEYVVDSTEI